MSRPPHAMRWWALTLLMTSGIACARSEPQHKAAAVDHPTPADAPSIYGLDLALVDAKGRTSHLVDLKGQTLIAAMMYSTCTSVCPRVTEDMKTIERQLSDRDRADVTFALFSLDPGRDTPEALRRFSAEHALDPVRWRLFAESEDGTRDLAAVLGVKYKRQVDGEIAHSAMIFVIDREGIVRHRQLGLAADPHELIEALASTRR